MKYMLRIWEKARTQHGKGKTLPPIIPVIFYHGARRWGLPLNFSSYFDAKDGFGPYVPEFSPVMVDLQQMDERRGFLRTLLEYIIKGCKDITERDVEQAILSVDSKEAREAYMTLAEQLIEKGKTEGMREGMREGKLEGKLLVKKEDLIKLLDQKFGAVTEADKRKIIETRDLDRLDQAIGLILKTETMAEVLKPLD